MFDIRSFQHPYSKISKLFGEVGRTRSKLYPHMGGQKGRFSSYFQKGGKVSQNVLGCFGGAYLKYFYKWSHICLKSLKCINKSTRLSFLKKSNTHGKKNHRPSKNSWKLKDRSYPTDARYALGSRIIHRDSI